MNFHDLLSDLTFYGPWAITLASAAATQLPPGKPGSPLGLIHSFINFLAFNYGYAENHARYDERWAHEREDHEHAHDH